MAWRLMKVEDLPLGKRVLSYGTQGRDVAELQRLLKKAGFYFSPEDGSYGPLTEEAVLLCQKAYNLKIDGLAGQELFNTLLNLTRNKKLGRIIYTIKERDSLGAISQKFAVHQEALERLPGQSHPKKGIYPGMKLLLHEKALYIWESPGVSAKDLTVTGHVRESWRLDGNGNLESLVKDNDDGYALNLISAEKDVWEKFFHTHKSWRNLGKELKKLKGVKFGFDLRAVSLNNSLIKFLRAMAHNFGMEKFEFLLLPLDLKKQGLLEEFFWLNLPQINCLADALFLQPLFDLENPDLFETSAAKMFNSLKRLSNQGFSPKVIPVFEACGWDWNLESGEMKQVTFKKAKIIHAMNSRVAKYSEKSKFTFIHYLSRGERHTLAYWDRAGWVEIFKIIKQKNFAGVTVANFTELGKAGKDLVADSFAVLRGK